MSASEADGRPKAVGFEYWSPSIVKMQTANPAGTVKLRSNDPRDTPEINFNYFTHHADGDLQAIVDGVELLLRAADNAGVNYTRIRRHALGHHGRIVQPSRSLQLPYGSCR